MDLARIHLPRRAHLIAGLALAIVAVGVALSLGSGGSGPDGGPHAPDASDDRTSATSTRPDPAVGPASAGSLRLEIDPDLAPRISSVPGLRDGDPPRPVGRVGDEDGVTMDIVLDEVMVAYDDEAALDRFVTAVAGEVSDRFDDAGEPVRDALVSFPRYEVTDPDAVAAGMAALEDDLVGRWTVSDPAVLSVLDLIGRAADAGVTAMPNALSEPTGFSAGSTTDGRSGYGRDAFTWPYVASGTAQDTGLDAAWRLLADVGGFDPKPAGWAHRVRIMVIDQGFQIDDDLPDHRTIRRASWNQAGDEAYGAVWHGASVVNALMGKVDNGFGGAGPAGPIDPALIAVGDADPSSWSNVRSIVRLVDEHQPDIVNMSYAVRVTAARLAYQDFYERKFSTIKHEHGALPVASAGNDSEDLDAKRPGALVERVIHLPCEARHVVCVGGMGEDTTLRDATGPGSGSNYGTDTGGRSVEIWAPYRMVAVDGSLGDPRVLSGTSFSAPFVAGVAALVKTADPSLDADGIWDILKETAHTGGVGAEVTGHQRRINAREAVRRAHGEPVDPPQVTIISPAHDTTVTVGQWLDLQAETRDHRGRTELAVTWMSNKDGHLVGPVVGATFTESLSVGTHSLVASVTDGTGQTSHTQVLVRVVERPITVTVSSPAEGEQVATSYGVVLSGDATDDLLPLETLDGDLLRWTVSPAGEPEQVVVERAGRTAQIPAGTLEPATYVARLSVTVGTQVTSREVTFEVVEPDPEEPIVHILSPSNNQPVATSSGSLMLRLRAHAVDWTGDPLAGTRLRWVARNGNDEQVLCAGTDTPGTSGGGGFAVTQACDDVEVALDVPLGSSSWAITLEGYASPLVRAATTHGIEVDFTPPPTP